MNPNPAITAEGRGGRHGRGHGRTFSDHVYGPPLRGLRDGMKVRRAVPALLLLLACTRSTELLPPVDATADRPQTIDTFEAIDGPESTEAIDGPESTNPDASGDTVGDTVPRRHYNFCPTVMDIYGGSNFLFPGCGGPMEFSGDLAAGLYGSEKPGYDSTLAGRLADRLAGDPDLVDQFGLQWVVRSCAGAAETLSQLASPLLEDSCGFESPSADGRYEEICSETPSPVLLLAASMLDDGCHGGGTNPFQVDDEASYSRHFQERLQTFLESRQPKAALVGNRTEWTDAPAAFMPGGSGGECWWQRPEWEKRALASWNLSSVAGTEVMLVGERNEEFKRHHRCCHELNLRCAGSWFFAANQKLGAVNCDGAQEIVNLWYEALKDWLLANDFDCPK